MFHVGGTVSEPYHSNCQFSVPYSHLRGTVRRSYLLQYLLNYLLSGLPIQSVS